MRWNIGRVLLVVWLLMTLNTHAFTQKNSRKKAERNVSKHGAIAVSVKPIASLDHRGLQEDFPALCVTKKLVPSIAYIAYDGTADTVRLAEFVDGKWLARGTISEPGNHLQPCLAEDGSGTLWSVWSELKNRSENQGECLTRSKTGRWDLIARPITENRPGDRVVLSESTGNHVFADAATDRQGRLWVAWQTFSKGQADLFARHYDPKTKTWSDSIQVTRHPASDWEPRLAFSADDEALVVFDSYRRGNFDIYLARVSIAGKVQILPILASDRYEARPDAAVGPDGNTLWIAYEDGVERWGKDLGSEWRKTGGGLHYDRHVYLLKMDLKTGQVDKIGDLTRLVPSVAAKLGTPNSGSICRPTVVVDPLGNPWVFFRFGRSYWQIATSTFDVKRNGWTKPRRLQNSAYCQDRRLQAIVEPNGAICVVWPSDERTSKQQLDSGLSMARFDSRKAIPLVEPSVMEAKPIRVAPTPSPVNQTPERTRDDRHHWTIGGQKYSLYWGDLHRHTDFSVCRTTDDGSIVEHFRYALDAAGLDYLATTDHTDAGKVYHPYEWWQTQKMADVIHSPGFFLGFYGYEREQRWPYGHRNVVYLNRGGPIIYIKRSNYSASQWSTPLPPEDGVRKGEIPPWQLWELLRKSERRVVTLAHTSAGGMGTDWSVYKQIDSRIENLVEIYQGSRNSYEGVGIAQPAVATQSGPMAFGKFDAGAYQNALRLGHKLGVFASSDHRSTNISFGGVYVKSFDRQSVFEAIDARRTIAATDKIFIDFSCNGKMMGQIFETSEKPTLEVAVFGTAPLSSVTIVRNEIDIRRFSPEKTADFKTSLIDDDPVRGKNRYYVRVEQFDGNMGWTSPVWVQYRP